MKTSIELIEGNDYTLTATVKPDDATDKTVTWTSSAESIATVQNGKVTAIKEGQATITAKAGEKSATCKVTVSKKIIPVTSITLDKTSVEMVEGDELTLTATVKPDDATDKTVTWTSSAESIATIQDGKVTAIKEGQATITAKAGEKSATCKVTVSQKVIPVTSITLDKTSAEMVEGDELTLTATVKPDDATDKNVTWTSSDESIATVQNGKVIAIKEGQATITAKAGEKKAECYLSVIKDPMNNAISFADSKVKSLLVSAFDSNKDGELSYKEAASVTDLGTVFASNRAITSFNEFQYFTSVLNIPSECFKNSSKLSSIILPASLMNIGKQSFYGCSSLKTISLPESVRVLQDECFSQSGLTSIELSNIIALGIGCFKNCTELLNAILPNSISYLPKDTFYGCSKIIKITVPYGITTIGQGCFSNCSSLTSVSLPKTIKTIGVEYGTGAFAFTAIKSIVIPESVSFIGQGTFYYCANLQSLDLPNGITFIGAEAFSNCIGLKSINIPGKLKTIETECFYHCKSLTSIVIPESVTSIGDAAFTCCESITEITIPISVSSLGKNVFCLTGLKSIIIPSSIEQIPEGAFAYCSNLTSVTFSEKLKKIDKNAFMNTSLKNVSIPDSVTRIETDGFNRTGAFTNCQQLQYVIIGKGLTSLGSDSFRNCTSLLNVTIHAIAPPTDCYNAFDNTNNCPIYVPKESINAYKNSSNGWKDYSSRIQALTE